MPTVKPSVLWKVAIFPTMAAAASAADPGPAIYQADQLDTAPKAIQQEQPAYPADVARNQVNGMVDIAFVIDPAGHVVGPRARKATVATASQSIDFDARLHAVDSQTRQPAESAPDYAFYRDTAKKLASAAMAGASQWTFQPGRKGGKPVYSVMAVVVSFQGPQHAGSVNVRVDGFDPTAGLNHQVPTMTNEDFQGMIGTSVVMTHDFAALADPPHATYLLNVTVRLINKIQTFSTTLTSHWQLTRVSDHKVMWEDDFTRTANSSRGQAQALAMVDGGLKRGSGTATGNAIANSQNLAQVATDNMHDALKEIWALKF